MKANELYWGEIDTEMTEKGGLVVSEYASISGNENVTIIRNFVLDADELVHDDLWTTEDTEFSDVFPTVVGDLDDLKGSPGEVVDYIVQLWNDKHPDHLVSKKKFEIVFGENDIPGVFFESNYGSKLILRPKEKYISEVDYSSVYPSYSVIHHMNSILENGNWDEVLSALEELKND